MKLQVALDVLSINTAIKIAEKALKGGAEIIEAGTPLIKYNGVRAIEALRKQFPDSTIVADMKTIDAGSLEAEIAFQYGADIVTVLGLASDTTIREVVRIAREYNGKVMVDLMLVENKLKRVKELELMDIDYIIVHTGLDEQKEGKTPFKDLKLLHDQTFIPIAVAGGITDKNISMIKNLRVDIVIVGGYITKSPNPEKAARTLVKILGEING